MKYQPYLLFLKKRQNLKLSSAANCRWRFIVDKQVFSHNLYLHLLKSIMDETNIPIFIENLFLFLFLLLYVLSQQLWSWRAGQFT